MPGYANWKDTFFEERRIMALEGYDISPTDSLAAKENESEPYWQDAYEKLWALRANGIKKDYPYEEPEDFESIIGEFLHFQPERFITYILFDKSVFLC